MGNNFFQQDPEEVSFSIVYKNNESPNISFFEFIAN
jgi:hypothetical protein